MKCKDFTRVHKNERKQVNDNEKHKRNLEYRQIIQD